MASLVTPEPNDEATAELIAQLTELLSGLRNTPVSLTGINDAAAYALTVKNAGTGSKALIVYAADGATTLLQVDGNGVRASSTGGAPAPLLTTTDTQTLTNKTLTSPAISNPTLTGFISGPLNLEPMAGGLAAKIGWGEGGAGLTNIMGNTVGGAPAECVLRFDIANGAPGGSTVALTLDGNGMAKVGAGGLVLIAGAAPVTTGNDLGLGGTTYASASAGTNGAPPAQVAGYISAYVGGQARRIPYYSA